MLSKHKKKTLFVIYINNGEIDSIEGQIPDQFLVLAKDLCTTYHPDKVKISCIIIKQNYELQFSGNIAEGFKVKLIDNWASFK